MKKKDVFSTVALILVLVIGLSLLLYPTISDWWNSRVQSYAVTDYQEKVSVMDNDQYRELWDSARSYNEELRSRENAYLLSEEQSRKYYGLLDVGGTGIMGYIEIPVIGQTIPLYHGTSEPVLQIAIGHIEWTSLPTGGPGTHCVVSGHRGLPSARLFTDLDKLAIGDIFVFHVLDETLTYEVDQIKIVEPYVTEDLLIEESKDLVTLVTCTPYGVNTHRLLVRGHRIENIEQAQVVRVTADAVIIEKLVVAPFLLAPVLLMILLGLMIPKRKNRRNVK